MPAKQPGEPPRSSDPVTPMNLRGVVVRRRNMHDPEIVIKWNSYMGDLSSLGSRLVGQVARAAGPNSERPDFLSMNEYGKDSADFVAVPVLQEDDSTVPLKWVERGRKARIDLSHFLMVRRFPIPQGTRAHIPLELQDEQNLAAGILVRFGQATFHPIEEGKKGAKATAGESEIA